MEQANRQGRRVFRTDVLVDALVDGRIAEAETLVEHWIGQGASYEDIAVRGFQEAMFQIGELWEQGRVSVAQEHLATAICHRLLVRAFDAETFAPLRQQRAVFACVAGNRHSLGLRIVSDTFAIAGWDVSYLGADLPTEDLIEQTERLRPDLIGLSVALPEHVITAYQAAARVREQLGAAAPRVLVGGHGVYALPSPPQPPDDLPRPPVDVWRYDVERSLAHL